MQEFDVTIEEMFSITVTIEAESVEDAKAKVLENWLNNEYTIDYNDISGVSFRVTSEEERYCS